MAFQLSPGVLVKEIDLTAIVPAVATTAGGFAGAFQWGPVEQIITVDSESALVERFGRPNNDTFKSFFTAANFLAYGNFLQIVRVAGANARNSSSRTSGFANAVSIFNAGAGYTAPVRANTTITVVTTGAIQPTTNATVIATFSGNVLSSIVIGNPGNGYTGNAVNNTTISISTTGAVQPDTPALANITINTSVQKILLKNEDQYENTYADGSGNTGEWIAKYPGTLGDSIIVSMADANTFDGWAYEDLFDGTPGTSDYAAQFGGSNDELHIIIIDNDGRWTGTANTVLEKFQYVSKASDAKRTDGTSSYYKDVINNQSKYVWWMDHTPAGVGSWGSEAKGRTFTSLGAPITTTLTGGVNDAPTIGNVTTGFTLFANDELVDVSLIPCGDADESTVEAVISICENRKDCMAFVSPPQSDVVYNQSAADDIIDFRNSLPSTSYAVLDSGWKYQYDRYNDVYRWVPLNGDIAGLAVRTDLTNDPWWSPAGLNRGQIKNVIKLGFSPQKTDRDKLYKSGVNPVVAFPGQGTVLFGDKTLLSKPSAFDRINVRRLFIVLEKAIATAAKYQLFEFNDAFTRAQFRNLVEPFLRDVQGRRGIIDFKVVCDESNNTGEVIDRNEFVADIYIKPNRSINFITLNFIATRTGISFEEVGA